MGNKNRQEFLESCILNSRPVTPVCQLRAIWTLTLAGTSTLNISDAHITGAMAEFDELEKKVKGSGSPGVARSSVAGHVLLQDVVEAPVMWGNATLDALRQDAQESGAPISFERFVDELIGVKTNFLFFIISSSLTYLNQCIIEHSDLTSCKSHLSAAC